MGRLLSDVLKWKKYLELIAIIPPAFQKIKYRINILQLIVTMCLVGRKGMSAHYARLLKCDVIKLIPVATRPKT